MAISQASLNPAGRHAGWQGPRTISYVVCDVDGTLVGPEALARPAVVDALGRARDAGIRVGYATGRMRDGVRSLHDQLDISGPHVLHNGAQVRADGETVVAWPLDDAAVDGLLALAHRCDDAYVEIYTESGFVASAHDERAAAHWELLGSEPRALIDRAADLAGQPALKATFAVFDHRAVADLVVEVERLGLVPGPSESPRTPDLRYVNVTHPDADKGRALRRAADHLDVPLSQVVAIGDATNDLSMFEVAGTAIAMGQAAPSVHAAAHLSAPSVDADGVAVAIDHLLAWTDRP